MKELSEDPTEANEKLSDALGLMWRKGLTTRYPAAPYGDSQARWAYTWDAKADKPLEPKPTGLIKRKLGFAIQEHDDGVIIDFEKVTVFIRPK